MFRSVQERRRNRARKRLAVELLESRRLLAAVDWTGNAGNGLWSDPANWSTSAVPGFDDDVTINVAGNVTVVLQGVQSVRSLVNHETLVLQGNSTQGAAVLQVSENSANSGVVELVSLSSNGNHGAQLDINNESMFTNQAGAELRVLAGSGSYRQFGGDGDFINDGIIEIETGIRLRSAVAVGASFRQQSGAISGSGGFNLDGLDFQFVGGSIATSLDGRLHGSTLTFAPTIVAPAELIVEGIYNSLLTDIPAGVSVTLEGNDLLGAAALMVPGQSEVHGSLVLTSTSSDGNHWASLVIEPVGELTIAAGGAIEAFSNGNNVRAISGSLVNRGSISETGPGAIDFNGQLTSDGGTYSGDFFVQSSELLFAAAAPQDSRLTLIGIGNTVSSDIADGYILEVQGNDVFGSATLALTSNIANHGQIELVSTSANYNHTANLQAYAGLTFTNATDGVVNVLAGAGSLRYLVGGGQFINDGLIHIEAGARLRTSVAAGTVIRQQDGEISGSGGFNLDGLDFQFVGGSIATSLDGRLHGSTLTFAPTIVAPAELIVEGIYNSLLTDIPAGVSVTLEGNDLLGAAALMVPGESEVHGSLVLTSTSSDGNHWASLVIEPVGELTIAAGGAIEAFSNGNNVRAISGSLVNRGSISETGPGAIDFNGQLTSDGGTYSGDFLVQTSELLFAAAAPQDSRLTLIGIGNTVSSDIADGYILEVQANDVFGSATLALTANIANRGQIELVSTSTNNNHTANLQADAGLAFTNATDGVVNVLAGAGSLRYLIGGGQFINDGQIHIEAGARLRTSVAAGTVIRQQDGAISGSGGFNLDGLDFQFVGGSIATSLDGRLHGSTLTFAPTIVAPAELIVEGIYNSLLTDIPAGVSVTIEGNDSFGAAALMVPGQSEVHGSLVLTSTSSDGNHWASLVIDPVGELTIAAGGAIEAFSNGNNVRAISGSLVNRGSISETGPGAIDFNGQLTSDGGSYSGDFVVRTSKLLFGDSVPFASRLTLVNLGNRVLTNIAAGYVLEVQGNEYDGAAQLAIPQDTINNGRIELVSTSSDTNHYPYLELIDDSTFRNSDDGRIQILGTINTPRAIVGNGTVINEGRITINEGLNLDFSPNATFAFVQRGGFVAGQGGIKFRSLDFDYLGGSISHTLDVRAENTRLSFSEEIIGPTTIVTEGSNELLSNVPRGVTINVEGNGVVGSANLIVAQPSLIYGTLQLSTNSIDGNHYPAINTIADGVVEIAPSGLLQVLSSTANIRHFNGHLVNAGRVVEVGETALIFTGRLDSNGGVYVGDILVSNSELYFQNSPEQSSALMLVGGNNLLSSDLTHGYELLVTGTAGGGEGILNTVNGVTNHGRIVLDSTADYDSRIIVENIAERDFFNGLTGTIESLIGSGGVRYLNGKLHNYGTVSIDRVLGLLSTTGTAHNYGNILINVANPGSLGLSSAGGLISHGPFGVLSGNGTATTQLSGVFDISLPALSGLQHSGTEITLKFASNGGLVQTSAENIAHYGLREAGADGVIGNSDDLVADNLIRSVSFDSVAETVTLHLATALPAGDYLLDIAADLIEDTNGAPIYLEPYALRLTVADVAAIEREDAENLLLNGSFELVAWNGVAPTTGAPIVVLAENATDIRGWQIIPGDSGGTLDWVGPAHFTASAGDYSVDLSGTPGLGGIQQTVRTRPGTRYQLQFDMGGNPYGNLLDPIEPPLKTLEVLAAGQRQVFEHELSSAATANNLGWVKKSWEFVAVDEWTTLSFRGLGPEGSLFGATLDNVRLSISDNLLVNGGFENRNPLDFTAVPLPDAAAPIVTIPGGSLIVAGWETVVQAAGDSLDWVDNSHFRAAEGQRSLDLNGTPGRGGVKQSFATEVGQEYELQFQFAGNPRGIALDPQADPFKAVEVQIAGQTLQFDLTVNQLGDPFVPHWQQRTVKFTATEPMTTVQFLSLAPDSTGPSSNYGPTLDDVVVRKVNNLVVNGSFEVADDAGLTGLPGAPSEPPSHAAPIYVLPQGSTALSGWTVAGVSAEDTVDWVHQTHIGASNGLRSVDLNGTPGLGSVSQTIATEVGRTYVMSFDLAGNPYGNGTSPASDPVKRIAVTIGGETIEYAHLVRGADSALRPGWQRYTTQFTATSAATLLRFASLAPDLGGPAGSGDYGAMLDNVVVFHADYGDLPNSYATLHSADGGRHLAQGAMLGTGRDFESDGQPGPDALLDGWDEDGVFIPTMQPGDTTAWMEVRVSQADIGQQLDAWIDFNADGAWDEPGEQVASTITVVEGLNRIYFAVPMDAVIGDVGARIRLSSNSLGTPTGLASDGEVEDYLARIDAPGSIAGVLWNDLNSNAVRDSVLVGGDDPDLVIVIDVSGSTSSSFAGSSVGNLNGDGLSDTILDAEIAGVYAILDYLIAEGKGQTSQVSIVTFSSGSTILDLNPVAGGLQASATPEADVDNNGIADIRQQIATIFSSGGTDFAAGLGAAKQAVDLVGTLRENANVIFMSDGVGQRDFGGALQLLRDRVSTIRAFGVGAGSSLDQLRQIDSRTVQFSTTDELIDAFSGFGSESLFAEPGIPAWEIYLDLNGNGQPDANEPRTRTSTDDPSTFANEAGKFRFDGLAAGTYEVRQVLPPGWWQTYPGLDADQTHTVVVVGGEVTEAVDFGVVFNQLPQAISDEVTVQWGSNATFDTRSNDFDPNGGPLTLRSVTNATNGTLEINNGQSITYTPAVGFSGVDSFTYTISDANGLQSTSTVTIILNGPATDLIFNNAVTDLNENSDNSNGTLLAELEVIDDDGLGTNYLSLSGTDAALFELIGNQLWLKAGVILDHESQVSFEVDINVDDPAIGSTPDLTRPFVLTINDLAEVVDVQFGDGTLQRSNVSQVIVTFDGVVDLGAGAFVLTERSSGTEVTTLVTTNSGPNGETIAQLIFSGGLTRNGGNLLDGNYRLQINATDVTRDGQEMDGDRDGVVGGDLVRGENAADAFFALFGDVNGDRTIRLAEFNQFRNTFGTNSLGGNYDGRFDFDDDEVIGLADFNQFRRRFGTSLDF